jgi:hypothetical protein
MRRRWRATAMGSRRSARRCTSRRCTRGMVVGGSAACAETMATTFVAAQIGDGSGLPMAMTFVATVVVALALVAPARGSKTKIFGGP